MSNDYFNFSSASLVRFTTAKAGDVANQFAAVNAGFNKLPDARVMREARNLYIEAAGSANVLTGTMPHTALASYIAGLVVNVKIASNNTGPVTINIDSLGAKAVLNVGGGALGANDLVAGAVVSMKYNGTAFTVDSTASAASVASSTAVAAAAAASASASAAAASAITAANNAASVGFTLSSTSTFAGKTFNLTSNTLVTTLAQINSAVSDADLVSLAGAETLTNKTVNLTSNTLVGTLAQFNTACSDADFASIAGSETLTNKTLTAPAISNPVMTGAPVEDIFNITDGASVDLNPANGTIQFWTLGANRTATAASFIDGQSMTLYVADGAAYSVTWPSVVWAGGSAPTLPTSGYATIVLAKANSVLRGYSAGDVAS